jgi:hypothetical protein
MSRTDPGRGAPTWTAAAVVVACLLLAGRLSGDGHYALVPVKVTDLQLGGDLVQEFLFPATYALCNSGRLQISAMVESAALIEPSAMRCDAGPADAIDVCGSASQLSFDLSDPVLGCTEGANCTTPAFSASIDELTCSGYLAGAVIQNTFPPQEPKLIGWNSENATVLIEEVGGLIPSGGGATFQNLSYVATRDPYVVYTGSSAGGLSGVYVYDRETASKSRILDTTMPRPRSPGNFGGANSVAMASLPGCAACVAVTDSQGAYVVDLEMPFAPDGAVEQPIAVGDTYAPGRVLGPILGGVGFWPGTDRVHVTAFNPFFFTGVYSASRAAPGAIVRHADSETPLPRGGGNFGNVQRASAREDTLFLEGFGSAGTFLGVYADESLADGPVVPALLKNQSVELPGGTSLVVASVSVGQGSALDGGVAALLTYFTGGRSGVVYARRTLLVADFEENDLLEWSSAVP